VLSRASRALKDAAPSPAAAAATPGNGGRELPPDRRAQLPETVVKPDIGVWTRVANLWRSRDLLVYLVRKELKVKYKDSVLGFLWSMLNPAVMLVVYYFVFQVVLKNHIPLFAIFLMCGLLVWNLFSTAVPSATTAIVANAGIVKKVSFARELLAIASVGAGLVFFFLQAIVLVIALLAVRSAPDPSFLPLLIPALAALLVFTSALAVFTSAVNVYFRDMEHLTIVVLMAWFWATPIVYAYKTVAQPLSAHHLLWLYFLNPITPIVLTFQRAIYAKVSYVQHTGTHSSVVQMLPERGQLWYLLAVGIVFAVSSVLFLIALYIFGRVEGDFAEEL
jgi:ABC-2 type transport system permease protein